MITAAGSNPAVMFLIDAVVNGQLTEMEAVQAVAALPLFVKTPTPALLDQLFVIIWMLVGDNELVELIVIDRECWRRWVTLIVR